MNGRKLFTKTDINPINVLTAKPMKNQRTENLLDQLLMLRMGNDDNAKANLFLEDCARSHPQNVGMAVRTARGKDQKVRVFIPPKPEDRVLMFSDNSGVYVHCDGLCTIMGKDIGNEIVAWEETKV